MRERVPNDRGEVRQDLRALSPSVRWSWQATRRPASDRAMKAKTVPLRLRLEEWPITRPIPYEQNARVHSEEQLEQLQASIEEFGQTKPIIVDEDDILLAGHGTLAAMNRGGHKTVIVRIHRGLGPEQKRAYRLADNRIALSSSWDEDLVKLELKELDALDYELELTGFTMPEIESYTIDLKKVRREKTVKRQGDKGHPVVCPKCHNKFRVE
jgi:ParB-like nuclease family protein